MGAIRFSLGRSTTSQQIDDVVAALRRTLAAHG
jgi:cysteine sulfinate desulfinase/cysteine desulfurase-like protein